MKILISSVILILAFTIFVNAGPHHPPVPAHIQEMRDTCLKELGISEKSYHEGKKNGEYEVEDCLEACITRQLGIIDTDGNIDKEVAKKNFPHHVSEENATRIVEACAEKTGENDCETAVIYGNCFKEMVPPPPMHQEMKKIHDDCKRELSLSDADVKELQDSMADATEDCFLHCVLTRNGLLNEDGTVNKTGILKGAPPHAEEEARTAANECAREDEGSNRCETALRVFRCFEKNDFRIGHHHGPPPSRPDNE